MKTGRELDAKSCQYCGINFVKNPRESYKRWNERLYCSLPCRNRHYNETKGRKEENWKQLKCSYCGKDFEARKNYVERGQYSYCSHECSATANRVHEVREFNGKRYYFNEPTGYYYSEDGTRMNRDVWRFYKGEIPEDYIVHHKDENKTNDDISNLELMERGEHTRHHNERRWNDGSQKD